MVEGDLHSNNVMMMSADARRRKSGNTWSFPHYSQGMCGLGGAAGLEIRESTSIMKVLGWVQSARDAI